ncbi:MAG: SDR family NAD(P)-dependent oxidoreductase, partial [Symploca sp. SIO1B1]|nr:SDR family NAD(P)-dependent oxidoreductase [Symploca sp. SIO1B1]
MKTTREREKEKLEMLEILGLGCRLPGKVMNHNQFWELLQGLDSAISEPPSERWKTEEFIGASGEPGKSITSRAGWLENCDRFDAGYFQLSPKEVAEMDPQQRLVLEVAHEALADANINPDHLAGEKVGVFVGSGIAEYQAMAFGDPLNITQHTMSGNSLAVIANRLSYLLNLDGPSMTVDTACSAGLTAFHLACQSLTLGDCDLAIVAAVNVLLGPSPFVGFSQAKMLSPRGILAPFDESADGFVRAEGCGVLLLSRKDCPFLPPLRRAYAQVLDWGVNVAGKTESLTMPSANRQCQLLQTLIQKAKIPAEDIVYVEAHGTGTKVGDPIESSAISAAVVGQRQQPLVIGSVKGHTGHLETAAGIVGVIKAALCLHHRQLVPTANHHRWPTTIDQEKLKLRISSGVEPLPFPETGNEPVLAVCSYGFGGANASVLLKSADVETRRQGDRSNGNPTQNFVHLQEPINRDDSQPTVLPLTCHYQEGLNSLDTQLHQTQTNQLKDLAAWMGIARSPQRYRRAYVSSKAETLFTEGEILEGEAKGTSPKLLFAFGGQGTQSPDMAQQLYQLFPSFREALNNIDKVYAKYSGYSVIEQYGLARGDIALETLQDVRISLPCIVFTQVALTELVLKTGVKPSGVLGHSTGEMVAAWTCGAITLEQLCELTYVRASLQAKMRPGAMAAWATSWEEADALVKSLALEEKVVIAAINAPNAVTLAGDLAAIDQLVAHGKTTGIRCTRLDVPRAYHSHHVNDIYPELTSRLTSITAQPSEIPFFSTVLGYEREMNGHELGGSYWVDNIAKPVHFQAGCQAALENVDLVLEISPRAVLASYLGSNLGYDVIPTQQKKLPSDYAFIRSLADLYVHGVSCDWSVVQTPTRFLGLPQLTWDHKNVYRSQTWKVPQSNHTLSQGASLQIELSPKTFAFLEDHVVEGQVVMPAAGFISLTLARSSAKQLSKLTFERFLWLWGAQGKIHLSWEKAAQGWHWLSNGETYASCLISSSLEYLHFGGNKAEGRGQRAEGKEEGSKEEGYNNCLGEHHIIGESATPQPMDLSSLETLRSRCPVSVDMQRLYKALNQHNGLSFGPTFQSIQEIYLGDAEAVSLVQCSEAVKDAVGRTTILLDGAFQSLAVMGGLDSNMFVPEEIAEVSLETNFNQLRTIWCHATLTQITSDFVMGELRLYDEQGHYVGSIIGLKLKKLDAKTILEPKLFKVLHHPRGIRPELRNQQWSNPVQELQELIQDSVTTQTLRILDLTEEKLSLRSLERIDEKDWERLFIAVTSELSPDAPNCVHQVESTEELEPRSFDVVVGRSGEQWMVPEGVLIPVSSHIEVSLQEQTTNSQLVFVQGLSESIWPAEEMVNSLERANLVVDARDSLVEASALLQEVVATEYANPPTLIFLIRQSEQPSPLWGFTRAARNEHPQLKIYAVAMPPNALTNGKRDTLVTLCREGLGNDYELFWENGQWQVPRLVATPLPSPQVIQHYRLDVSRPGQLESMGWRPVWEDFEQLRPNEIRVHVQCVSMHFKDVMLALGLLKGFKPILGMECSGTIVAVGSNVPEMFPELQVGQDVLCLSMTTDTGEPRKALFGTTAIADARCVFPKPTNVSHQEAAGFLGVYATAWYALHHIARLQPGETVLIHSAAGGVGHAAIQIAQRLGARIIASAGTEEKHQYLQTQFGISDLLDSHQTATFVDRIHQYTNGKGVDVVLNSLAGEGLRQSLRCLAPKGRHIEIGKRDILEAQSLGLYVLRNNISFHSVHLDILDETHPEQVRSLVEECNSHLAEGRGEPLPTNVFSANEVSEAFRLISTGKHLGKIVVEFPEHFQPSKLLKDERLREGLPTVPHTLFRAEETQLITGGTGGVGLALARLLARCGAGRILLVSRRGITTKRTELEVAQLRAEYPLVEFVEVKVDVTDAQGLQNLLESEPSITGIFHTATTYDAETTTEIKAQNLPTWNVKVQAAQYLHKFSQSHQLRHFVLVTSLAGLHGNTQQAVYVAANAALQELARQRRQQGMPALAIDLPILLGVGRLSEPQHIVELDLNTSKGFGAISFAKVEPWLEQLFAQPEQYPAVVSLDHPSWYGYWHLNRNRSLFQHLVPRHALLKESEVIGSAAEMSGEEVDKEVRSKVAFVLGAKLEDIDPEIPLLELGVDSLAAMELANWTSKTYGVEVSQTEFLSGVTSEKLVASILGSGKAWAKPKATPESPETKPSSPTEAEPEIATSPSEISSPLPSQPVTIESSSIPSSSTNGKNSQPLMRKESSNALSFEEIKLRETEKLVEPGYTALELPESLTASSIDYLLNSLHKNQQVLVLRSQSNQEHFCLGMDLGTSGFGDATMSEGLDKFTQIAELLREYPMPVIAVVDGACRGGGMLFPSLASIVLATQDASFGFPEIRRGGLPGVVSVAAQRRMSAAVCERYFLTGDSFDAATAKQYGLVDFVGSAEEVEQELKRLLGRFAAIEPQLLSTCKTECPAPNTEQALITMGGLDPTPRTRERDEQPLVRLLQDSDAGVLIIELN